MTAIKKATTANSKKSASIWIGGKAYSVTSIDKISEAQGIWLKKKGYEPAHYNIELLDGTKRKLAVKSLNSESYTIIFHCN